VIYTWDPEKNRRNIARHGIAFEDAVRIFEGLTLETDSAWRAARHEREAYWQIIG
jgi:uncharacterized DUF497 family protein